MWVQLKDCLPEAHPCKLMVDLLDLAGHNGWEAALAQRVAAPHSTGEILWNNVGAHNGKPSLQFIRAF